LKDCESFKSGPLRKSNQGHLQQLRKKEKKEGKKSAEKLKRSR